MLKEYLEGKRKMEENSIKIQKVADVMIHEEVKKFVDSIMKSMLEASLEEINSFLESEEVNEKEKFLVSMAFLEGKKKQNFNFNKVMNPDLSDLFKDF